MQYDGIVTISGNRLISEVLNGALNRKDVDKFIELTAFGFIPMETINGF